MSSVDTAQHSHQCSHALPAGAALPSPAAVVPAGAALPLRASLLPTIGATSPFATWCTTLHEDPILKKINPDQS